MVEMKDAWQQLDEEIAQVRMPEEYRNFKVQILCKDCHLVCSCNVNSCNVR